MDKVEKETQDFMNVDSFSQLPFIRPAPPPPPPKEKGIRLFGIEFGDAPPPPLNSSAEESESAETTTAFEHESANNYKEGGNNNAAAAAENGESSSRRFECHYCCRNFPTSQALGGHQNAHKRERQHAKRQHLQSAMVHGTISEGQVYGLMNYRFGSFGSSSPTTMPTNYPTWNNNNNNSSSGRFYGTSSYSSSLHHQQQPINGSPLAMWRIPNSSGGGGGGSFQGNPIFNRDRAHPLPLFSGEEMRTRVGASSRVELGRPSSGSQNGYVVCDSKTSSVSDHVSLDLHL